MSAKSESMVPIGPKVADVIPAFAHLIEHAGGFPADGERVNVHQQKGSDDGEVTEAVKEEAPAFAESGDHEAGDGGADETSAVGHRGVDGDGIREVVAVVDHLDEEGLAGGHVEGVDEALERGEGDDLPKINDVSESERGHGERLDGGENLRPDEQLAAIKAFDPYAGERAEKKGEDLAGEADDAEKKRGVREAVNEPASGEARHPCADKRDALAEEVELEVAVTQRAPGVRKPRERRAFGDRRGCWRICGRGAHFSARRLMISAARKRVSRSSFV